jgi:eukaryotic-like serine/threonine-protein kinase
VLRTAFWIYEISRNPLSRLTLEGGRQIPIWTPDGKKVTYRSVGGGLSELLWKAADGSGPEESRISSQYIKVPFDWTPDGKLLVFHEVGSETGRDLWLLPMEGKRKPRVFLQTPATETGAALSPDGHWIAYVSDSSVYVRAFPGPGGTWQISTDSGSQPRWAPDGKEIFYRNGDAMLAVPVQTQPTFSAGTPKILFRGPYERGAEYYRSYDVSADGQHFLMVKPLDSEAPASTQINVVLNWFEELKKKVPVH